MFLLILPMNELDKAKAIILAQQSTLQKLENNSNLFIYIWQIGNSYHDVYACIIASSKEEAIKQLELASESKYISPALPILSNNSYYGYAHNPKNEYINKKCLPGFMHPNINLSQKNYKKKYWINFIKKTEPYLIQPIINGAAFQLQHDSI